MLVVRTNYKPLTVHPVPRHCRTNGVARTIPPTPTSVCRVLRKWVLLEKRTPEQENQAEFGPSSEESHDVLGGARRFPQGIRAGARGPGVWAGSRGVWGDGLEVGVSGVSGGQGMVWESGGLTRQRRGPWGHRKDCWKRVWGSSKGWGSNRGQTRVAATQRAPAQRGMQSQDLCSAARHRAARSNA